jgi:hypothetical protein
MQNSKIYRLNNHLGLASEPMILDSTLKNAVTKVYYSTVIADDYTNRDRASLKVESIAVTGRLISLLRLPKHQYTIARIRLFSTPDGNWATVNSMTHKFHRPHKNSGHYLPTETRKDMHIT